MLVLMLCSACLAILNNVFFFLAMSHSMSDLSSLTRDQTHCPLQWKCGVLTTGPPGKSEILNNLLSLNLHFVRGYGTMVHAHEQRWYRGGGAFEL